MPPTRCGPESSRTMSLTKALSALGPVVSLDVETDGIKPTECGLLCVGLSDGVNTVVIWPWKDSYGPELTKFLQSRQAVVCHNGMFDILVLSNHNVTCD